MPGLRSFVVATRIIGDKEKPDGHFAVRGLNLSDLMRLVIDHGPMMSRIYDQFITRAGGAGGVANGQLFTPDMVKSMMMDALKEAPELVFAAVAYATDDESVEAINGARRLPLVLQLEAMLAIMELSIQTDAELKKLQEVVLEILSKVTNAVTKMNLPVSTLDLGFGKSANG